MAILKKYNYYDDDEYKKKQRQTQADRANKPGEYVAPAYSQSSAAKDWTDRYSSLKAPAQQESAYLNYLNNTVDQILNREEFSYDLNGDALYQQYKDQYLTGGNLAMQDAMGQAASLTGGYGNSFATSAGQQAYQRHVQGLTDKIPELYQMALDRYNAEGDDLYNRYALLSELEGKDYNRYQDSFNNYMNELSAYYGIASDINAADRAAHEYDTNLGLALNDAAWDRYYKNLDISTDAERDYRDTLLGIISKENSDTMSELEYNRENDRYDAEMDIADEERKQNAAKNALNDAVERYTYFGDDSALRELGYTDAQIEHLAGVMAAKNNTDIKITASQESTLNRYLDDENYEAYEAELNRLLESGVSEEEVVAWFKKLPKEYRDSIAE